MPIAVVAWVAAHLMWAAVLATVPGARVEAEDAGDEAEHCERDEAAEGEDADGELYLLTSEVGAPSGTSGKVYRIEP